MEPKYEPYPAGYRYRPFCVDPAKGLYVVVDARAGLATMPHPKLEYYEHPWRGMLLARALTRQEADNHANSLNGVKRDFSGIYKGQPSKRRLRTRKSIKKLWKHVTK